MLPALTPQEIATLNSYVAEYIQTQRSTYRPRARPVTQEEIQVLNAFFPVSAIDQTRVCVLDVERVKNPAFYPALAARGFNELPDFSAMSAITFCDIIVSHGQMTKPTLFHEFVHVLQYERLGIQEFARLYVDGFLKGGSYEKIPLEQIAYELEHRFSDTRSAFDVRAALDEWLRSGKL